MPRITYPKKSKAPLKAATNSQPIHKAVQRLRKEKPYVCTVFKGTQLVTVSSNNQAEVKEALKTAREELMSAKQHASSSNVEKKHNDTLLAGLSKLSLYNDTDKNPKQDLNLTLPSI